MVFSGGKSLGTRIGTAAETTGYDCSQTKWRTNWDSIVDSICFFPFVQSRVSTRSVKRKDGRSCQETVINLFCSGATYLLSNKHHTFRSHWSSIVRRQQKTRGEAVGTNQASWIFARYVYWGSRSVDPAVSSSHQAVCPVYTALQQTGKTQWRSEVSWPAIEQSLSLYSATCLHGCWRNQQVSRGRQEWTINKISLFVYMAACAACYCTCKQSCVCTFEGTPYFVLHVPHTYKLS